MTPYRTTGRTAGSHTSGQSVFKAIAMPTYRNARAALLAKIACAIIPLGLTYGLVTTRRQAGTSRSLWSILFVLGLTALVAAALLHWYA